MNLRLRKLLIAAAVSASLVACGRGDSELRQWIDEVKARPGTPIEPIPPMKQFETFDYNAQTLRDPFAKNLADQNPEAASGPNPSPHPKEELENYPLDALDMVGTLGVGAAVEGLVKDPEGVVHRVHANNYLGQNYGRITAISEGQIELVELVPNGVGGWIERPASVALEDNK